MTENLAIAIIGSLLVIIQTAICFIVSRCFTAIDRLNEKFDQMVKTDSCNTQMCKHEEEIRNLWKNTRENSERITKIEAKTSRKD